MDTSFAARTGAANPLAGRDVGDESTPAFVDLDGDGDFDLLAGRLTGDFDYFENIGDATSPLFATSLANPFGLGDVGSNRAAPVFGDRDGDGDLDLVSGGVGGQLRYFQNVGSAIEPAFSRLTGPANPLTGTDVGQSSAPAAADLNGDGHPDLVTGSLAGTFAVHYVPEPAGGLLLATGIPLLGLLARRRRPRPAVERA